MIRTAVPADLTAVMRIARQGFTGDDRFGTVWLVKLLAYPGTVLYVDDAGVGVIRGFMVVQSYAAGDIVRLIATDKGFRQQGVGRALLDVLPRKPVGAWIRSENTGSQALFAGAGFTVGAPKWTEAAKPERHTGDWIFYTRG